jgi:hypothetical protein
MLRIIVLFVLLGAPAPFYSGIAQVVDDQALSAGIHALVATDRPSAPRASAEQHAKTRCIPSMHSTITIRCGVRMAC